jgi:predicted small secreted protein
MKKCPTHWIHLTVLAFFMVAIVACSGCETIKGAVRGIGQDIKDTDEWFRENFW